MHNQHNPETSGQPPADLRAETLARRLVVTWLQGHVGNYPYKYLRGECHCASCVDEWTGVRRVDPASIPLDIVITNMRLVGNYAIQIDWSDGHTTGIYTWERLRELCPCPKCKSG